MAIHDLKDNSLWSLIIEKYYPKIVNYLYFTTGDRFLSEDIAQEAFAVAIDKFDQLKNPDKFLPWITSIALNTAKTQIKRNNRIIYVENTELSSHFIISDDSPSETSDRKETEILIQKAIAKLSPQEQNVVIMRYYLDMKLKDIAFTLRVTEGTVKRTLFRAKAKLYDDLQFLSEKEGELD